MRRENDQPAIKTDDPNNPEARAVKNHSTGETPGFSQDRNSKLKSGQSYTLAVDVNAAGKTGNHAVQVGKDSDGRLYVYDPYPSPIRARWFIRTRIRTLSISTPTARWPRTWKFPPDKSILQNRIDGGTISN